MLETSTESASVSPGSFVAQSWIAASPVLAEFWLTKRVVISSVQFWRDVVVMAVVTTCVIWPSSFPPLAEVPTAAVSAAPVSVSSPPPHPAKGKAAAISSAGRTRRLLIRDLSGLETPNGGTVYEAAATASDSLRSFHPAGGVPRT